MEFLTKLLGIATAVAETTTTTGAADPAAPVVVVVSATAVAMPKSLVRNSMRISSFR